MTYSLRSFDAIFRMPHAKVVSSAVYASCHLTVIIALKLPTMSLICSPVVLQPTTGMSALWVMVRPVNYPALFVPNILAGEANSIALADV
jgi:hypothetical protein